MKLVKYILCAILLLFVLAGGFAFAQIENVGDKCSNDGECTAALGEDFTCVGENPAQNKKGECLAELPEGPQTAGEVLVIITIISNWVFAIFLAVAIIFLIWGAFEFVTGEGNPEKVSAAKRRLLWAVIGIALALLANGVDDVLRSILT